MTDASTSPPYRVCGLTELTRGVGSTIRAAEAGQMTLITHYGRLVAWMLPLPLCLPDHTTDITVTHLMRHVRDTVLLASGGEVLLLTRRAGMPAGHGDRPGVALLVPANYRDLSERGWDE